MINIWFGLVPIVVLSILLVASADSQQLEDVDAPDMTVPAAGIAIQQCNDCYTSCYPRAFHYIDDYSTCICTE